MLSNAKFSANSSLALFQKCYFIPVKLCYICILDFVFFLINGTNLHVIIHVINYWSANKKVSKYLVSNCFFFLLFSPLHHS